MVNTRSAGFTGDQFPGPTIVGESSQGFVAEAPLEGPNIIWNYEDKTPPGAEKTHALEEEETVTSTRQWRMIPSTNRHPHRWGRGLRRRRAETLGRRDRPAQEDSTSCQHRAGPGMYAGRGRTRCAVTSKPFNRRRSPGTGA